MTDSDDTADAAPPLEGIGQSIVAEANLWIAVFDGDLQVLVWNDEAAATSGYTAEEVVGSDEVWQWLYPDESYRQGVLEYLQSVADGDGSAEGVETEIHTADGDRRRLSLNAYQVSETPGGIDDSAATVGGGDGETATGEPFDRVVAIGRDVTGEREREAELRRYETILETIDDGVYVLDGDGRIVYVNESYAEMKGVDKTTLLGTPIDMWADDDVLDRTREMAEAIERGDREIGTIEYEFRTADGDAIPAELRFTAIEFPDGTSGRVGAIRDVSDRRARDRALERQNERLEAFASVVSHDLRNPLNVAAGRLDLARSETDDEEVDEHLAVVARSHDRMETLIDDLLTLTETGRSIDELEPVDPATVIRECWTTVETGGADLVVEIDRRIHADRNRLQQLLENLLRNAVEHGGSGVTIELGELPHSSGLYVEDDGPGIPEADRDRIFESGFTTSAEGHGFGLAIVSEIVEAHGWSIEATESDAGGARFEITGVTFAD